MKSSWVEISFPTDITFGPGCRKEAANALLAQGVHRPLIVTDHTVRRLPLFAEIVGALTTAGFICRVYDGVSSNPLTDVVELGRSEYLDHGADSIVGIGGGAPLEVAKGIALMAQHPGKVLEYAEGADPRRAIDQPIPYLLTLPTTAGTGSEVGRSFVIGEPTTRKKRLIFHPRLMPRRVLADPEMTLTMPHAVTAATAFDALTCNIEAYLAKGFHPLCDGIAQEGVSLIAKHLPIVLQDPGDLSARGALMMAALMSAVASQKGLGVTHSCAHALSSAFDTHHGVANALMLPASLSFYRDVAQEKLALLGLRAMSTKADESGRADDFLEFVVNLRGRCKLPKSLRDIQAIPGEQLVQTALQDGCHQQGPRSVNETDLRGLFDAVK